MRALLKNYRQSPRKVRLVADLVRGKSVSRARSALRFLNKRAALPVKKVLESAVANAKNKDGVEKERLIIKEIRVDKGFTLKRFMPRARGRATPIHKRASHLSIVLEQNNREGLGDRRQDIVQTKA